jgi:hypothetical protein
LSIAAALSPKMAIHPGESFFSATKQRKKNGPQPDSRDRLFLIRRNGR